MERRIFGIPDRDFFFDSWPFIILMLLLFFPVGFILLLRKKDLHRRNVFEVGNTSMVVGILFFLLSIVTKFFFSYLYIIDEPQFIEFLNIFKVYGIIIFVTGVLTKLQAMHYKKYIYFVTSVDTEEINTISQAVKEKPKKVEKTLNELIQKNYLKNYQVKENKLKHVSKDAIIEDYGKYEGTSFHPSVNRIIETNLLNAKTTPTNSAIQCPNCGANNKISYTETKCTYCNSDLAKKRKEIVRNYYYNKKKANELDFTSSLLPNHKENKNKDILEVVALIIFLAILVIIEYIY